MIDKKTLILAATMVPMLGLADVEAMQLDGFHNRIGYTLQKYDKVQKYENSRWMQGNILMYRDNDLIRKNDALVDQNNKLIRKNAQLENDIIKADEATEFLYFYSAELNRKNAELDMMNTNLEKQVNDLELRCVYLGQCIAEFNQIDVGFIQQSLLRYQRLCEDKEKALNGWKDYGKKLRSKNEQLKLECADWEQHSRGLWDAKYKMLPENANFKKENASLINQVEALKKENADIKCQLDCALECARDLGNENGRLNDNVISLRRNGNEKMRENNKLQREVEQLRSEIVQLRGKILTLQNGFIGFIGFMGEKEGIAGQ